MRENRLLISASILLAASMSGGVAWSQSSGKSNPDTIHPDVNESTGGSKSERSGGGVPLPKGSPSSGTVEKGQGGSTGASQSPKMKNDNTGSRRPSDTTKGKDTDQPSQGPAKQ